jgi:hypothetical protein
MAPEFLTKSLFLIGLQCPKYLWMSANRPELLSGPDPISSHRFNEGNIVETLAKSLFPDGIPVPKADHAENLRQTRESLSLGKPLFEAGFQANGYMSRADILCPAGDETWDLIEVKASLNVREVHMYDIAFQRFSMREAGLRIDRCFLMHVKQGYVRQGELNMKELLRLDELTHKVRGMERYVRSRADKMLSVLNAATCPEVPIGEHCSSPYDCPFKSLCWAFLPSDSPLSLIHLRKKTGFELIHGGHLSYTDLPPDMELTEKQEIQIEAARSGVPHMNAKKIRHLLESLEWPLYFLDFETYDTAIPLYDGTWPYQKVPFQFSLHRLANRNAKPVHVSFLGNGRDDPRPALLEKLKAGLGDSGSIIVYNESFEKGVLAALADFAPSYRTWANEVTARIRDLLPPFLNFAYYHPAQNGSASIKSVLPALTGRSYDGLSIGDGMTACMEYVNLVYGRTNGRELKEGEAELVRADLEKYCSLDTEAMILVLEKLTEAAEG